MEKLLELLAHGKIGKAFISIMNGFGTKILVYDKYKDENLAKEMNFEYVALEELYKRSDIISLHCPLTDENYKMISKDSLSQMKDGVILINTSRGKLIDSQDLIDKLEEGKIGGLGLDVYEEEENFFLNDMSNSYVRNEALSVLLSMPNVVVTSHQAFFTKEALDKIAIVTLQNIKEFFETGDCENRI